MTPPPTWTEDDLQRLLYEPQVLLADAAWRQLIAGFGGLDALYAHLRTLILPERQRAALLAVLDQPLADADQYAARLHVHRTTFYRQQRQMFRSVAALLNAPAAGQGGAAGISAQLRALYQLRPPASDFTGRDQELATLLDAARRGAGHEPRATLAAIHGMGGVGKTELAFAAAHRLREQFPDAQLVLELRGARETPMTAAEALQAAIRSFAPQEQLPDEVDALQQRYRSLLDGKRVLVLADDARDAAQVRPLIPPLGCLLLVTSRQRWTLPGMASVQLAPLSAEAGPEFLRQVCERLTAEEAAAIAAACEQLPLALRVSGSLLATNPALSVARYIARLGNERERLGQLRDPDDAQLNVAASLELSYAALEPLPQRLLRQLAALAADFDTDLALDAAELPEDTDGEALLHALLRRNVIVYDAERDRWRLHDLVRSLALQKLAASGEEAAIRLRYARAAVAIAQQIKLQYMAAGAGFAKSLVRFDEERPHLDEMWRWAFENSGSPAHDRILVDAAIATNYAGHIRYHFRHDRLPQVTQALAAANRLQDQYSRAMLSSIAGVVYSRLGDIPLSIENHSLALEIFSDLDAKSNAAKTLVNLASQYLTMGGDANIKKSIDYLEQSMRIYREINENPIEISVNLNNLGLAYAKIGDRENELKCFKEAIEISRSCSDDLGRARALCNSGAYYSRANDFDEARSVFEEALEIVLRLQEKQGEFYITKHLASLYARTADVDKSLAFYEQALALTRIESSRMDEAAIGWSLGILLAHRGDDAKALLILENSCAYYQEIGHTDAAYFASVLQSLQAGGQVDEAMLRRADLG